MSAGKDPKRFGKVAVLLGGKSAEREVSLKSGNAVLAACKSMGIDVHPIDPRDEPLQEIVNQGFDRVFIALHGRGGEDGSMQGALEILGVPYTGSGVMASAIGMDKLRTKLVWSALGLPSPKFVMLNANTDFAAVVRDYALPLMVKPAHEGSSVGMTKVKQPDQLQAAWQTAAQYDSQVFAEQWITGKEYTCAILGDVALPMIRLETPNEFYDYDAKYIANTTQYHCPCGLDANTESQLQQLAKRAFDAVGCSGWGRVDMLTDLAGNAYLIEVNTVPGLTDHSLVPMAARQAGIGFNELVERILEQTL